MATAQKLQLLNENLFLCDKIHSANVHLQDHDQASHISIEHIRQSKYYLLQKATLK